MIAGSAENRRHPRVPVSMPAQLNIALPDEFEPPIFRVNAELMDVSEVGALVRVPDSTDARDVVRQKLRTCMVELRDSPVKTPIPARTVWVGKESEGQNTWLRIGLNFGRVSDTELLGVQEIIETAMLNSRQ